MGIDPRLLTRPGSRKLLAMSKVAPFLGLGFFLIAGCNGTSSEPASTTPVATNTAPTTAPKTGAGSGKGAMSATLGPGAGSNPFGSKTGGK